MVLKCPRIVKSGCLSRCLCAILASHNSCARLGSRAWSFKAVGKFERVYFLYDYLFKCIGSCFSLWLDLAFLCGIEDLCFRSIPLVSGVYSYVPGCPCSSPAFAPIN
jgi:hypothetical protein